MITFHIITIFPNIFDSYLNESILRRAQKNKLIKIKIYDLRKFSKDKHHKVDDKPFGGGPGMVMQIEPLAKAIGPLFKRKTKNRKVKTKVILFSPTGKQFTQKMAINFSKRYEDIVLVAGRYEGVDARLKKVVRDMGFSFEEVSIGPYVLTGGELPAMALIDSVSRQIKGVLGRQESLEELRGLGTPAFTRPEIFKFTLPGRGKKLKEYRVPKVLLSGNHKKIEEWRRLHSF
jgi:tRNA (guanine37-N1)-methyltransferase